METKKMTEMVQKWQKGVFKRNSAMWVGIQGYFLLVKVSNQRECSSNTAAGVEQLDGALLWKVWTSADRKWRSVVSGSFLFTSTPAEQIQEEKEEEECWLLRRPRTDVKVLKQQRGSVWKQEVEAGPLGGAVGGASGPLRPSCSGHRFDYQPVTHCCMSFLSSYC